MAVPIKITLQTVGGSQARREIDRTASTARKAGSNLRRAFGGTAVVAGITKTISLAKDFDLTMRQVAVQTGQTGRGLDDLSKLALKMGADTVFSAKDASAAMLELAKGGMNAAQIKGGALQETLRLAAAGNLDLASSASYVVQGLTTYGLKARQAKQVSVALAGGANASTASVESLGQALSQVGPGAVNAGLSIQETVAALAAFDNAGIKGADAGTSLKTMLSSLVPVTDKSRKAMAKYGLEFVKRNGDFKNLRQIAGELKGGLSGLGEAERVRALKTIFGSDATRAATVLMKEGAKGITGYVRATKNQRTVQDMANAAMEGASGAWENFTGTVETAAIKLGTKMLPAFTKAANYGSDFINEAMTWGPAIEDSFGWVTDLGRLVLPPLKLLLEVGRQVTGFLGGLPGPVKEIGVQAAVAALVLPRLSFAVLTVTTNLRFAGAAATSFGTSMLTASGRAAAATTAMTRLSGAAKTAAGVGGMVALTQGASTSNKALSALANVGGGAMLGFSVGGPIGAAIGAGAGAMLSLYKATGRSATASTYHREESIKLRDALDQETGAVTRAARAKVAAAVQTSGMAREARALGLASRDVVSAVLGNEKALHRVEAAARKYATEGGATATDAQIRASDASTNLTAYLNVQTKAFKRDRDAVLETAAGTKTWAEALKVLPKEVRTRVRQEGYTLSIRQIRDLSRAYNLTPKQVRTLVRETGSAKAKKDVDGLVKSITGVGKSRANLGPFKQSVNKGLTDAKSQTDRNVKMMRDILFGGTGKAKANLNPFQNSLVTGITKARGTASSGGAGIGNQLANGMSAGVQARAWAIADAAASAVRNAIRRAKIAAEMRSPSRATRRIGIGMGDGLVVGLRGSSGKVSKAMRRVIEQVLSSADDGARGITDRLRSLLEKAKIKPAGIKARIKSLTDETKALAANARAQEKNTARLQDAKGRLRELVAESKAYAAAIKGTIVSFGDVTTLGQNEDGSVSITAVLDQLKAKVNAAKRYADLLRQLRGMNLNETSIQNILDAGPEGGLSIAEALISGGPAAIAEVNQLTKQLAETGSSLGDTFAKSMRGAGIQAAQGMVDGLERMGKRLDRAGERLALSIVRQIKKTLGIKSPSRVFRDLGKQSALGVTIGLRDVNVRRAGVQLADDLAGGFGTPALAAFAAAGAGSSSGSSSVSVLLSAEQFSQLERGRRVRMDLDVFDGNGGGQST